MPAGKVTKHTWTTSTIYPGTTHDYWVYVPAQYDPAKPAAVMVFQDGAGFVNETGHSRVPIVFDNLIHKGEMPVTIGIFISPGIFPLETRPSRRVSTAAIEYDAVTGRYARFLIEEILPEVGKSYNLTTDPNLRAISGSSSGGNCSFTAAWERPDYFRRVMSFIAGFTHQRGALILPSQVRKFEGKPLRIFLQDGTGDVNIQSNQDMIAALDAAGYDAKLVVGSEGHNMKHGGPLLPDALRWVWRDWTKPIAKPQQVLRFPIRRIHLGLGSGQRRAQIHGRPGSRSGRQCLLLRYPEQSHSQNRACFRQGKPFQGGYRRRERAYVRTGWPTLRLPKWPSPDRRL